MSARALVPSDDEFEPGQRSSPRRPLRTRAAAALAAVGLVAAGCAVLARGGARVPSTLARGEVTQLSSKLCKEYPYLKFELPGAVVHNNLAGKGPMWGQAEGIVYKTLDLGQGAGDELDKEVYLVINATSRKYVPFASKLNGMQGKYGSINLKSGSQVDLKMTFLDRKSMEPLVMPDLALTFFDLDTAHQGKSREFVTLSGFTRYHLTDNTEVKVSELDDGATKFEASTFGDGHDNPTDPMFLTHQQKNRAVTAFYRNVKEVSFRIGAGAGVGPRFFTFVGRPSLLCAVTVQEGFKPPLPDISAKPPMQVGIKAGEGERFISFAAHRGDQVQKGQGLVVTQAPNKPPHTCVAPYAGTVVAIQDGLVNNDELDLRLDDKTMIVVQRPYLDPLPQGDGVTGGGPGAEQTEDEHLTFERYLVEVGDLVDKDQPVVLAKNQHREEVKLKATDYGSVKARQEGMTEGSPLAMVKDRQLITVGPFAPLPRTATQGAVDFTQAGKPQHSGSAAGTSAPSDDSPADVDSLTFVSYAVEEGDTVSDGDKVATVKDKDGKEYDVLAPQPGVVKHVQRALREGMLLPKVIEDNNIATLGRLPALDVSRSEEGSFAPVHHPEEFTEWKVEVGDSVRKGDTVAVLVDPTDGSERDVQAGKSGSVTERLEELQPGDIVEEVTKDEDLVTVGKLEEPETSLMKPGVKAEMDDVFDFWIKKQGERVHCGEPIAQVTRSEKSDGGRRLSAQTVQIPSPGAGTIDYEADLQPGKSIKDQSVGPTIARVDLGWPWWLMLLGALLVLCCCFCCLFKVMQKPKPPPVYTPMEPEPVEEEEVPPPPEGLRLDFNDGSTIRTVYAKYRPLGIKHNFVAPIIAHDFTINSYAKQDLQVQDSWELTRIGDEDVTGNNNFKHVNDKLTDYMKDFPLWPLPLEFRKALDDPSSTVASFVERPIGLEFTNNAPIRVSKIHDNSPAQSEGVEVGWFVTKIGECDVHENHSFRDVMKILKEGVKPLDDLGRTYNTQGIPTTMDAS
uniref:Uncharacterized protein n=1 Tax=Alexandrium monilatum TaxID=311494 RepID=A0A7S4SQ79_9DINO